jgi:hypothetical protein
MKLGIIEDGKLKGKKIVLEPREGLENNLYLVSKGTFLNGSEQFALHCLICEKEVPGKCTRCNKKL